jgi:hypothetical protein
VVEKFLATIEREGKRRPSPWGNLFWRDVHVDTVADLLRAFQSHPLNMTFQGKAIADFLQTTSPESLKHWDVVVPNGSEQSVQLIDGLSYRPQKRSVNKEGGELLVSGSSARVASRGAEREGLDKVLADRLAAEYRQANPQKKSVPDHVYREGREHPLLLVHGIVPYVTEGVPPNEKERKLPLEGEPVIALGLSFPRFDDSGRRTVTYRVNTVEWKNWFDSEVGDDQDADDEAN